jgi:hypothetical protein
VHTHTTSAQMGEGSGAGHAPRAWGKPVPHHLMNLPTFVYSTMRWLSVSATRITQSLPYVTATQEGFSRAPSPLPTTPESRQHHMTGGVSQSLHTHNNNNNKKHASCCKKMLVGAGEGGWERGKGERRSGESVYREQNLLPSPLIVEARQALGVHPPRRPANTHAHTQHSNAPPNCFSVSPVADPGCMTATVPVEASRTTAVDPTPGTAATHTGFGPRPLCHQSHHQSNHPSHQPPMSMKHRA